MLLGIPSKLEFLPLGVIGNTSHFDCDILGSSPGGVASFLLKPYFLRKCGFYFFGLLGGVRLTVPQAQNKKVFY